MELKKLQTLAEGKNRSVDEARRLFDSIENSLDSVEMWVKTGRLADLLAKHKFPATESKAFVDALKALYGEFEDLKQGVITGIEEHSQPED